MLFNQIVFSLILDTRFQFWLTVCFGGFMTILAIYFAFCLYRCLPRKKRANDFDAPAMRFGRAFDLCLLRGRNATEAEASRAPFEQPKFTAGAPSESQIIEVTGSML